MTPARKTPLAIAAVVLVWWLLPKNDPPQEARKRVAKGDLAVLRTAVELFAWDHGHTLPESLQDLVTGQRKYLRKLDKDPWGTPYAYQRVDSHYKLFSAGPDRVADTRDDIVPPL